MSSESLEHRLRLPFIIFASIMLLALYLRLLVVSQSQVYIPLRADAGQYVSYAYNLKFHGVYAATDSWRTGAAPIADNLRNPGYSLLLIPFLDPKISAANLYLITVMQAIISTLSVTLVFFTMRRFFHLYIAAGAALLTAISPHLLNANTYILTESAAAFSMVVFLWLYAWSTSYHGGDKQPLIKPISVAPPSWRKFISPWFLLGLAIAAGTLIRPTLQWFLLPLLGIVYALPVKDGTTPRKRLVWVMFGFIALMLPWWIRNILQFSELSNSSLMINTLHHGMYPNFTYAGHPESFGFPYRFDPRSPEIAASLSSVVLEIVRRFIVDPGQHLYWFIIGKPLMFWNWSNDAQGAGDVFIYPMLHTPFAGNLLLSILHETMRFLHVPLVVIGMISSVFAWLPIAKQRVMNQGRLWFWRMLSAVLLYFMAIHMVGAPFPRYNIPVLPVLYMQVMLTLSLAGEYFRKRKYDEATAARSMITASRTHD